MKFCIDEVEGSFYLCSKNKGTDQLRGYRTVHVFSFAYEFSHDAAQPLCLISVGRSINVKNMEAYQNFQNIWCNVDFLLAFWNFN